MANVLKNFIYIAILVIFSLGASAQASPESSPESEIEAAKKDLERKNIPFDERSFIEVIAAGDESSVKSFLIAKMNPNAQIKDEMGTTPLATAVFRQHLNIAKMLIENGADVNLNINGDISPLYIATDVGNFDLVQLLINKGANINGISKKINASPLWQAVNKNFENIAIFLIDKGAEVNFRGADGITPIHLAAAKNEKITQKLIEKGAVLNLETAKDKYNPLHVALINKNYDCAMLLANNNIDLNKNFNYEAFHSPWIGDDNQMSPIHVAVINNKIELLDLLIKKGANINAQTKNKNTPLLIALLYNSNSNEYKNIIELLLEKGADWNIKNNDGSAAKGFLIVGSNYNNLKSKYNIN